MEMSRLPPASETGRVPLWARFDPLWYRAAYSGTQALNPASTDAELEVHYRESGARQGLSPNPFFDEAWYRATNPDVNAAIGAGTFGSGLEHYLIDGFRARAPHWLFSEAHYRSAYPDITQFTLGMQGLVNGYDHYLAIGSGEFRSGHLFFNPVLFRAAIEKSSPTEHVPSLDTVTASPFAALIGMPATAADTIRTSWYFDPGWYLHHYPDVAAAIAEGRFNSALHHFLSNPSPELYSPNAYFSESDYRALYPDILGMIGNGTLRSGCDHFVRFGCLERRKPREDTDLQAYFLSGTVRDDIEHGMFRDAFAHFVARREQPDRGPAPARASAPQAERIAQRKAENIIPLIARNKIRFDAGEAPVLSVIVALRNRFPAAIAALQALRTSFSGPIDLIVLDLGSMDDSSRIERFIPGAHVFHLHRKATLAQAFLTGIRQARTPLSLWLGQHVRPHPGALDAALRHMTTTPEIGVVTGKMLRPDATVLEAGAILWRDGSLTRYQSGSAPDAPEASFLRDASCATTPFILARTPLLSRLDGIAPQFKAHGTALADLVMRIRREGFRAVFEPTMLATVDEAETEEWLGNPEDQVLLAARHAGDTTVTFPSPRLVGRARSPRNARKRILFIEDRMPLREIGSGFVRANDVVHAMAELGHQVTALPIYPSAIEPIALHLEFPRNVEILHRHGIDDLGAVMEARSGSYDCVWISRTHNLARLMPILRAHANTLPLGALVLDTEAVSATRAALRAEILALPDKPPPLDQALAEEFAGSWACDTLVAVNALDAQAMRRAGLANVVELGHMCPARPTPAAFSARRDMLFLGAIHDQDSPNLDSLIWFAQQVIPLLQGRLPDDVGFTIAGWQREDIDLTPLGDHPRIRLLGAVSDLEAPYASHRIFVAPTRFAGGIPFKVHEAASFGLPCVASDLLCRQLDWRDSVEIISGGHNDPQQFANAIITLYSDEELWNAIRSGALRALAMENSRQAFVAKLNTILEDVFARAGS